MREKDLEDMVNQYAQEMRCVLGIPVHEIVGVYLTNTKQEHGSCTKFQEYGMIFCKIKISKYCVLEGEYFLQNIILHELCHAATSMGAHHGKEWKEIAKKVGDYYHTDIERTENHSKKIQDMLTKYVVSCKTCGHKWNYIRKGKVVKTIQENGGKGYTCPYCNTSAHFEVKEK